MKRYKLEINIDESDVEGDEFWEECLEEDPTGINPLYKTLCTIIEDSNLLIGSEKDIKEIITLKKFEDK